MTRRNVIELAHARHAAPIPSAVLIDRLLVSSALFGAAADTGAVPEAVEDEIAALFANFEAIVKLAGASLDDVARVGVLLRDNAHRGLINGQWLRLFPNEGDRPARHITIVPNLPAKAQLEFIAMLPEPEGAS